MKSSKIFVPQVATAVVLALFVGATAYAQSHPGDGEWGDAPEGAPAYPSLGIDGEFPTCFGGPNGYVFHANMVPLAYFGPSMDPEPDGNAGFCPQPPYEMDECWGAADGDGGLVNPDPFSIFQNQVTPCGQTPPRSLGQVCEVIQWGARLDLRVENDTPDSMVINVLFDWDQSGFWDHESYCGSVPVPEHVVHNLIVPPFYSGLLSGLSPGDIRLGPNPGYVWARFTISNRFPAVPHDWDGSGFFDTGETEDYLLWIEDSISGEYGDAPEGKLAYPTTQVQGAFPTCVTSGPAGYIRHVAGNQAFFGSSVDFEPDGNAGDCDFTQYDQDECSPSPTDTDAGIALAGAYTISPGGGLYLCPGSNGQPLGPVCTTAVWGQNIDITVNNSLGEDAYVNVLADWSGDGAWGGASVACGIGAITSERVLENFVVPDGYGGPLSILSPPDFNIGTGNRLVWFRFTITKTPLPLDWTGDGVYDFGETEDYLLATGTTVSDVPEPATGHSGLQLEPNVPNPFNPRTDISFSLPAPGRVRVTVHDMAGRLVATLADDHRGQGRHTVVWEGRADGGRPAGSGVYFARVVSGGEMVVRRMVMLK